jgi:hypothetical protein
MNATKVVENYFESAKKEIMAALETRMTLLLTTIKEIETQDLEPLTSLKQQLDGDLVAMKNLITEGNSLNYRKTRASLTTISTYVMFLETFRT